MEIGPASIYFANDFVQNLTAGLPRDAESTAAQPAKPRVLVVDDERLIADTCAEILAEAGFSTKVAYDGWAALEIAPDFQPDYLLADVLMPRMNGVELAISISKMLPAIRILLFSGQAGISDILFEGHERGFEFELLAKPLHPTKLIERLKNQKP